MHDEERRYTRGAVLRRAAAAAALAMGASMASARRADGAVVMRRFPVATSAPSSLLDRAPGRARVLVGGIPSLVGVLGRVPADLELRVRHADLRWTRWIPVRSRAHGPDGATGAPDPVWVGAATEVELRTKAGSLRGLDVVTVRAPSTTLARVARLHEVGGVPIAPRAVWDDGSCTPLRPPTTGAVQVALVHHTASLSAYTADEVPGIIRSICSFHQQINGWNDIGYNFLVDRFGGVYEGRAGGIDQAIVGAHALGCNSISTGVACIGSYDQEPLPDVAVTALAGVLAWKLGVHGCPTAGTVPIVDAAGAIHTLERIGGHRDCNATECPGALLYGQLADVRMRVGGAAPVGPALTLAASAIAVAPGTTLNFAGRLTDASGAAVVGATVDLVRRDANAGEVLVAQVLTDAAGQWTASAVIDVAGDFIARSPSVAIESPPATILLVPAVSVRARLAHRHGQHVLAIDGTADSAAAVVVVLVERRVGGRWRQVVRWRVRVRRSTFTVAVPARHAGAYRVTATAEPGATTATSTAAHAAVRVPR